MTPTRICLIFVCAAALNGQDMGSPRGEDVGGYNITDTFETGYRFATVGGDLGNYQSDVNYGNGIRLLSSSFTANSKNGQGTWFDDLSVTTMGLGNDPYQAATLRVEKNRWYEYDFSWRQNSYYNPGLTIALGQHLEDLVHRWQDHDLTFFPQRWYRIHAGFSDVTETGPALSTVNLFTFTGNQFPIFSNVRRRSYEYRLGVDLDIASWRITVLGRYQDFRDDTPYNETGYELGNDPSTLITLSSFQRTEPYHGTTPGGLVNFSTSHKLYAVNGHFTYEGGNRDFVMDEMAIGATFLNPTLAQETFAAGTARRPLTTGDLSASWMPTDRLTIVNNSSIQNTRIDGNVLLEVIDNELLSSDVMDFQFLGIRTFSNSTDLQYRFTNTFSGYTGYEYSERMVRSIQEQNTTDVPNSTVGITGRQVDHLNTGTGGFNWLIAKPLRLRVEGEIGRDNNPYFPIGMRDFHAIDARLEWRSRAFHASAGYKEAYNNNSISITAYSSRSRNWFADASWTANSHVGFDLSYNKLHLDTIGGIAFFAGSPLESYTGLQDEYISNLHVGNAVIHWTPVKRADVFLGYVITRDAGADSAPPATTDPAVALIESVRAFPLVYQSPFARISIKLAPKLRWNASYQYYGYHEDVHLFGIDQDFRAHTGTVSLLWAF
jgi:hypothetical protein